VGRAVALTRIQRNQALPQTFGPPAFPRSATLKQFRFTLLAGVNPQGDWYLFDNAHDVRPIGPSTASVDVISRGLLNRAGFT